MNGGGGNFQLNIVRLAKTTRKNALPLSVAVTFVNLKQVMGR